ncbi:MAG TPA: cytochrome c [Burkholderiales bacterium]|nr:cytochrome c [Burkholderiales bacterium]
MKKYAAAVLLGGMALGAGVVALAQMKPEDAIKYRQSAMFLVGQNFGPLAAMAQGKLPYDKEAAIKHADIVAFVSKLPLQGFQPGTDTGGNTKAKPEIWENMDDFKGKLEKMQQETAKLAEVAQSGDFNALKAQVGDTGKACKACHDKYRNK